MTGASQPARSDAASAEDVVRAVWVEALDREDITSGDDFFDLGGHSLLALMVNGRLQALFDADIPLALLFDHPRLADFADALGEWLRRQ